MEAIYSKSLKAGDRTYFIDVKEAKNKSKYLNISETRPSKDGENKFTRSSVMVFENHFSDFRGAIDEALNSLQK
jgi:hypothetical protein